jgi:hypothetical protein
MKVVTTILSETIRHMLLAYQLFSLIVIGSVNVGGLLKPQNSIKEKMARVVPKNNSGNAY